MITLQNSITINHRKGGRNKYDRKLTQLDVVTMSIRYSVNGIDPEKQPGRLEGCLEQNMHRNTEHE